jgi:pimeloyl-ACP methyl ester carboxylesterase
MNPVLLNTALGPIEYAISGRGRPILFIHGGHVNCRETIFQKRLDPERFLFLRVSRPGYGQTPLTDENKTPKGTAELLVALLDKLQIQQVTVFGISAGGLTALEMAGNFPQRIEKLVLMGALTKKWFSKTDRYYKGAKWIFAPRREKYTWLVYSIFFKLFPKAMTRMMFKQLSKHRPVQFTMSEYRELRAMTLSMRSGSGFSNDLDQDVDQHTLSKIITPTLILHSENDHSVDISHAQHAKEGIKQSRLLTFKNRWGHLLWLGAEYDPVYNAMIYYFDN